MRRVPFSETAVRLFRGWSAVEQVQVREGVALHLRESDPFVESRNKFRLRRPSPHAEYELRLGALRVFYRVTTEAAEVVLIGRKRGEKLLIAGEEFEL